MITGIPDLAEDTLPRRFSIPVPGNSFITVYAEDQRKYVKKNFSVRDIKPLLRYYVLKRSGLSWGGA